VRCFCILVAVAVSDVAAAQDLYVPLVQPDDVIVVQMVSESSALIRSGATSFLCETFEEEQAIVLGKCKPLLPAFLYSQLQFGALARVEDARLQAISEDEIDRATIAVLRGVGCTLKIGSLDSFDTFALDEFGRELGTEADVVPFVRETVQRIGSASLSRLFTSGNVAFLENRSKAQLRDCS